MTATNCLLGTNAKMYRNTGSYNSPTWAEIDCVSDLTVKPVWDKAEANKRASRVKRKAKTLLDLAVSFKALASLTDANYLALQAALYGDGALDLLVMNAPTTSAGAFGWRADWQVFEGSEDQGQGAVEYDEMEICPAPTANPACYVTTDGNTLTYHPL